MDKLRKKRRYWKVKEKVLDRNVWRTGLEETTMIEQTTEGLRENEMVLNHWSLIQMAWLQRHIATKFKEMIRLLCVKPMPPDFSLNF